MLEAPDQTDPSEPATGREFLIATDLLLLLLDDDSGRAALGVRDKIDPALAGAVLAELALAGAADIVDADGVFRSAHVTVVNAETVTDPVLQDALAVIAEKDRSPKSLISKLKKGLRQRLLDRLADAGILEPTKDSFLIVFERTRWPAVDSTHEAEVRVSLEAVLLDGETPDARTGVLVALLDVIGQAHKVITRDGVSPKTVKKRAAEIAEGSWATDAVKKAIQAATSAGGLAGAGIT